MKTEIEQEILDLMAIQIQLKILQVDFSLRGALEHLKELSIIYGDIAIYIIARLEGSENIFDVFSHIEEQLIRVAGENATQRINDKVNGALSRPSIH